MKENNSTVVENHPVIIDALEGPSWGGIVIACGADTAFGLRFAADTYGLLDGESIYEAVREVGPHAPDASYCRLKWSVAPAPGDMFSIRWTGQLKAPMAGDYTFYVTSDDGCRLYIDGRLIIDEWWDRVPTEFQASIHLSEGIHDLQLDYYESTGSASVKLEWSSANIERQVIPASALSCDQGPGLLGAYYFGTEFHEPAFERVDEQIDFDYGHSGPLPEREVEEQVCLEWSRVSERTVVGRLVLERSTGGHLLLLAYYPWDYSGRYAALDSGLAGDCAGNRLMIKTSPRAEGVWFANTPGEIKSDYTADRQSPKAAGDSSAGLKIPFGPDRPVYFTASIDGTSAWSDEKIDERLASAANAYAERRTEVSGAYERAGESITNNIHWMRLLIPHTGITYLPAGRVWLWSGWTVFEWDGFFNALLASVEHPELALSMIDALLLTQQPNGNFPNVANDPTGTTSVGRSQPQVGSYCAWKLYLRLGLGRDFLEKVYLPLMKWHEWWLADGGTGRPRRDGNGDGLLEWGSDNANMQDAKFESGMDDAALFDDAHYVPETWTMNMNSVDCSSLYALDALCLARIARELGLAEDESRWLTEHARMAGLINEHLWCDEVGLYLNRFWDGTFSQRIGCANLYPLIAQVATPERAKRMMSSLHSPDCLGGRWMIPTISRSDPAYKDQGYWRGTVWPPTNYLAYEGIKTYGFDAEAALVAESGADLFLGNWKREGTCRENYRSDTGEGGGQKYQSWGPLFSLIILEEFADVETDGSGLRFGSLSQKYSAARRMNLGGHVYDVETGPALKVFRDDQPLFYTDGPVVIRSYSADCGQITFSAHCERGGRVRVFGRNYTRVLVDGASIAVEQHDGGFSVSLPSGWCDVKCLL